MSRGSGSWAEEDDDFYSIFGRYHHYSSDEETVSVLSKSIDFDLDLKASTSKGKITQAKPPPLVLTKESEIKEESLLFEDDRVPTPASPFYTGPRHAPQRSDESFNSVMSGSVVSFRTRFSAFAIDNSCFDLGALSGEQSTVGTPVEKVFPKDIYSASLLKKLENIERTLEEQKRELASTSDVFFPHHTNSDVVTEGHVGTGPSKSDVTSGRKDDERSATADSGNSFPRKTDEDDVTRSNTKHDVMDKEPEEKEKKIVEKRSIEGVLSESSDDEKKEEKTLKLSPSPPSPLVVRQRGGRMSIRAIRKHKSASEVDFSLPSTSKRVPPRLDLVVGGPGCSAPPLPPSPDCVDDHFEIEPSTSKETKEEKKGRKLPGKQYGNLRLIEILRVKVLALKGVRGQSNRPLFIVAKLDQKDIHHSAPLLRETCEQFVEEVNFDDYVSFSQLHLVILEGSRAPGKAPRPIGRVSLKRREMVRLSGKEFCLPLRVVSKCQEVQGQICLDIRRENGTFSLRVVDYSGLRLREPQELYLLVTTQYSKESRKLRIHASRFSEEWLSMPCEPKGVLQIKMTLWHDLLRGLNNVFHGQVRVDVDERWSNGPSKWFYLRPRHSDQQEQEEADKENNSHDSLGEVKMWMSYTADHVLSSEIYKPLMDALCASLTAEPFSASLISLLENLPNVDLGLLSRPLVQALAYTKHLRPLLALLYASDVERCQDWNTLFRSQTLASKMLNELLTIYGHQYLTITLKPVLDKIYKEQRNCEVDPTRLQPGESLEKNLNQLLSYFNLIFGRICESASRCPQPIRLTLSDLRRIVGSGSGRLDVQRLALSSFLIMRFFAAAILSPHNFCLKNVEPKGRIHRTLVLLCKMLQRLANCCVSGQPLIIKEPYLTEAYDRITDDGHKASMYRYLDRISLHATEPSLSTESIAVLKEGYLLETRSRQVPYWRKRLNQKKRYVMLTDTDLIWQKSHRGELNPKGTLTLTDITSVTVVNKSVVVLKTATEEVAFEAASPIEADDWMATIDKERARAKKYSARKELSDWFDSDIERQMEAIHLFLVGHADTLTNWKAQLAEGEIQTSGDNALPPALSGSLLEDERRNTHQEALLETIEEVLSITYSIETAHRDAIAVYTNMLKQQAESGTRENPIGDDGYLLLKRQLKLC